MLSLIKNNPEITYTFADFTLNNLEIKHALFRGNKKPPNNYLRLLSDNDSKLGILDLDKNQRLKCLFVAQEFGPNDYDMSLYQLRIFTRKGFNEQVKEFMKDFYNKKIKFDNSDSSYSSSIIEEYKNLKIPLYIYHYISDFGRPEDFYSFLFQYDNKEKSNEDLMNNIYKLVQKVITKEINVTFE